MDRTTRHIAGLHCALAGDAASAQCIVVLLHGYAMRPEDLEPFAHSLGLRVLFCFPQAPIALPTGGHAWWPVDEERRTMQLACGPRDLAGEHPANRPALTAQLEALTAHLRSMAPSLPLVLGGFSQGGMLSCDAVLRGLSTDGLVLLSASRIALDEWQSRTERLRDLPVFMSHGEQDPDLSFAAGIALRDLVANAGANVAWHPFDGPHEIPLTVWRGLKRFLQQFTTSRNAVAERHV